MVDNGHRTRSFCPAYYPYARTVGGKSSQSTANSILQFKILFHMMVRCYRFDGPQAAGSCPAGVVYSDLFAGHPNVTTKLKGRQALECVWTARMQHMCCQLLC